MLAVTGDVSSEDWVADGNIRSDNRRNEVDRG